MRLNKREREDLRWLASDLIEAKECLIFRYSGAEFHERYSQETCATRTTQLLADIQRIKEIQASINKD